MLIMFMVKVGQEYENVLELGDTHTAFSFLSFQYFGDLNEIPFTAFYLCGSGNPGSFQRTAKQPEIICMVKVSGKIFNFCKSGKLSL